MSYLTNIYRAVLYSDDTLTVDWPIQPIQIVHSFVACRAKPKISNQETWLDPLISAFEAPVSQRSPLLAQAFAAAKRQEDLAFISALMIEQSMRQHVPTDDIYVQSLANYILARDQIDDEYCERHFILMRHFSSINSSESMKVLLHSINLLATAVTKDRLLTAFDCCVSALAILIKAQTHRDSAVSDTLIEHWNLLMPAHLCTTLLVKRITPMTASQMIRDAKSITPDGPPELELLERLIPCFLQIEACSPAYLALYAATITLLQKRGRPTVCTWFEAILSSISPGGRLTSDVKNNVEILEAMRSSCGEASSCGQEPFIRAVEDAFRGREFLSSRHLLNCLCGYDCAKRVITDLGIKLEDLQIGWASQQERGRNLQMRLQMGR